MASSTRLTEDLKREAYRQGVRAGRGDLPFSLLDWEPEFQGDYRRGHEDGKVARDLTEGIGAQPGQ